MNLKKQQKLSIIAVVGPTATGKTVIGASIARKLQSEVISVDSQQVYQGLPIGTAQPTQEEMQGVPHHMIAVVPPTMAFSAGNYREMATPILKRLISADKTPVLVGGTGFYLRSLLQPQHLPQVPIDPAFREMVQQRIQAEGLQSVYEELQRRDPERAAEIHPNNAVRIIRALEIITLTGKTIEKTPVELAYPTQAIGLTYANRELHIQKIRQRLDKMVEEGFLDEVAEVFETYGLCFALRNAHGYPELLEVLQGKRTLEDALEQIAINIRQYSRRQMTWFRQFPGIAWYAVDEQPIDEVITDVIDKYI